MFISEVVEQPKRDVNHSSPSSATVRNEWSYTSTPPICLHGVDWEFYLFYFLIFPELPRLDKHNRLLFKSPCFKIPWRCLNYNSCDSVYRVTFEILTKNRKLKEIVEEKEKVVGQ